MPFGNYNELFETLEDYLNRPDLDERIPDWIRLAEIRTQRESNLRLRFIEKVVTGNMVASQDYLNLSDFDADAVELRWIRLELSPLRNIQVASEETFTATKENVVDGIPRVLVHRGLQVYFAPTPGDTHAYTAGLYTGIPALTPTGATNTNWLLANAPDCLLYGALLESEPFLRNDPRMQTWGTLYDRALASLKRQEVRARLGGGPLRTRADSVA